MAFWTLTNIERSAAYGVSEQGEQLQITPGAPNTYGTVLDKDRKTPVLPPGTTLATMTTHAQTVIKRINEIKP